MLLMNSSLSTVWFVWKRNLRGSVNLNDWFTPSAKQQISTCTAEHFREIAARKLLDFPEPLGNDAAV